MLGDRYLGMGQAQDEGVATGVRPQVQEVSRNARRRLSQARRWYDLASLERVRRVRKLSARSYV